MTNPELWRLLESSGDPPEGWPGDEYTEWAAWAKGLILSAKLPSEPSPRMGDEAATEYACRLLFVLKSYSSEIITEDRLLAAFAYGLILCGADPAKDSRLWFLKGIDGAKRRGLVLVEDRDFWKPGMRSGSGWVKCFTLTGAGEALVEGVEATSNNAADAGAISEKRPIDESKEVLEIAKGARHDVSSNTKKRTKLPEHTEEAVRRGIERALSDLKSGILVATRNGRVTKAEVAKRCHTGPDHIKHSEEWKYYYKNGVLRPRDEPTKAERAVAVNLLEKLLPDHPHLRRSMENLDEEARIKRLEELTVRLIPVTKRPENTWAETGHATIRQFIDDTANKVHPLVT